MTRAVTRAVRAGGWMAGAGAVAIAVGVGLVHPAAGVITAGVELICAGYITAYLANLAAARRRR